MSKRAKKTMPTETESAITHCARQGDVLLLRTTKLVPAKANELPREGDAVVLAHGGVTGHKHQIKGPNVALLRIEGAAWDVLRVTEGIVDLVHEEHATIRSRQGRTSAAYSASTTT